MRLTSLMICAAVFTSTFGCGYLTKHKKNDDGDNSADAIADDSAIHWDTAYSLSGRLASEDTRKIGRAHV